jgi:hypothetical protein
LSAAAIPSKFSLLRAVAGRWLAALVKIGVFRSISVARIDFARAASKEPA